MCENDIAKTLKIIGIIEIVCGIILGFIILIDADELKWIGIAVMISSFITGMLFLGFGEMISLLQRNVNAQEEILVYTKSKALKDDNALQTVLQDIESNLPNI